MGFYIGGGICFLIALILFFVFRYNTAKFQSIMLATPAKAGDLVKLSQDIAQELGSGNWRDYVKVSGTIQCDRPLSSEFKQEPCVYFSSTITREFEETVKRTDSEGKTVQEVRRMSETVSHTTRNVPFAIADDTGSITVNPDGAALETIEILNEFRAGDPRGGLLSFGGFSLALGDRFLGDSRRTLGYRYTESVVPVDRHAFVLGAVSDASGTAIIEKPTKSKYKYVISLKSEDQVAEGAKQTANIAFYSMIASAGLGVILVMIKLLGIVK